MQKVLADCAILLGPQRAVAQRLALPGLVGEPQHGDARRLVAIDLHELGPDGTRTAINQTHKVMPCADGSVERAAFVYRFWSAIYQEHLGRLTRRQHQRFRELRDGWQCAP